MNLRTFLSATTVAATAHIAASAHAAPKVVTTIAPIHSLTAMVMRDVGEPVLLVPPGASPHEYALRPSEARALDEADAVVWVGEQLETFMTRPIAALAPDARLLTLAEVPSLRTLAVRTGDDWADHHHGHEHGHADAHGHDHAHGHGHSEAGAIDPHLWLDSGNARLWLTSIAEVLAEVDPGNAAAYRSNTEAAIRTLDETDARIVQILSPVQEKPYVVFHDAYQYFETQFGTNPVGAVSPSDAQKPGAAHVQALRQRVQEQKVVCIFSEPQFEPRLVATLSEGTNVKAGMLDPLGGDLQPGPGHYPSLMEHLAQSLRDCLT